MVRKSAEQIAAEKAAAEAVKVDKKGNWLSGGIDTPNGLYVPQTDNLTEEAKAAARFAGLSRFKLFINGDQILSAADLKTNSIKELTESAHVEGTDASVSVQRYDRAG